MSDNVFWPKIVTKGDAEGAAVMGAGVMGVAAVATATLSVLSLFDISYFGMTIWSLVDAGIFAGLCWGIIQMSRVASIVAFLFYTWQQYELWVVNEIDGTPILTAFFMTFLFQSVRGSIYYHRFKDEPDEEIEAA